MSTRSVLDKMDGKDGCIILEDQSERNSFGGTGSQKPETASMSNLARTQLRQAVPVKTSEQALEIGGHYDRNTMIQLVRTDSLC